MSDLVVRSPWDGSEAGRLPRASPEEVERAVARARAAFDATRALPTFRRAEILRRAADLLAARREELARTIAREAGKPIRTARGEADRAVATFRAAAAALEGRDGVWMPLDADAGSAGRWGVVKRFPIGPVLAITPFNFPLNLSAHKVAPAIAVGAPIVQKPASQTPLSAAALREACLEAGWPEEAYALLPVPGAEADRLVEDPRLPVVSFTGSGAVGWAIRARVPRKRVSLELGGNAAVIVHADADPAKAVARAVPAAFGYAGQSCISLQRALVHRSLWGEVQERFVAETRKLVCGDPLDEATDVGPMIAEGEAARAEAWVKEAVAAGAVLLAGGTRRGSVLEPTVLARTDPAMKVECEEVFAPVVTLAPYDDFEDALARANASKYGLQAGLFTRDLGLIEKAFATLEVGGLVVNDVPTWRADRMPYGGVKESGNAREGPAYAMETFTEPRLLVLSP